MIPSLPAQASSTLLPAAEMALNPHPGDPDGLDFGALLDLGALSAPAQPAPALTGTESLAAPADLPGALPVGGKILPVDLPPAASPQTGAGPAPSMAIEHQPVFPPRIVTRIAADPESPVSEEPGAETEAGAEQTTRNDPPIQQPAPPLPKPVIVPLAVPVPGVPTRGQLRDHDGPEIASRSTMPSAHTALPFPARTAESRVQMEQPRRPALSVNVSKPDQVVPSPASAQALAPAPSVDKLAPVAQRQEAQFSLALPAARQSTIRSEPAQVPVAGTEAVQPQLAQPQYQPPAAPGAGSGLQTDAAPRPHDFAGLIDRLVAARDAVQPQAVSIAVQHADFGEISLRLRHDGEALSVSLASADPDFARIASTATPPVMQALAAEAPGQGNARPEQSATGNAGTGGSAAQSRGGSAERREDQPRQQPRTEHRAPERGNPRGGIFA